MSQNIIEVLHIFFNQVPSVKIFLKRQKYPYDKFLPFLNPISSPNQPKNHFRGVIEQMLIMDYFLFVVQSLRRMLGFGVLFSEFSHSSSFNLVLMIITIL